ncbi:hypothetical protein K4I05_1547 [Streptococcus sanguinis]|nr:hypothetical protein [Streptococcus sanguinis]
MLEWVRMAFSDKLVQEKLMGLFLKRTEKGKSRPPPVAV